MSRTIRKNYTYRTFWDDHDKKSTKNLIRNSKELAIPDGMTYRKFGKYSGSQHYFHCNDSQISDYVKMSYKKSINPERRQMFVDRKLARKSKIQKMILAAAAELKKD